MVKNQLIVNAGHGLDYSNVSSIAHLDSLSELNIDTQLSAGRLL